MELMNNNCCETEYIVGLEAFVLTEQTYKQFNTSFNRNFQQKKRNLKMRRKHRL